MAITKADRARYARNYRAKHKKVTKAKQREYWLKHKYGLTLDDFDALAREQVGVCAICHRLPEDGPLHVDHCHTSGDVRGLLCGRCNRAIGLLDEEPLRFESAAAYLGRV